MCNKYYVLNYDVDVQMLIYKSAMSKDSCYKEKCLSHFLGRGHLKAVIHGLKFARFSKEWLNFDPCKGKLVVQKSLHQSLIISATGYSQSVINEVSLPSEQNSTVEVILSCISNV